MFLSKSDCRLSSAVLLALTVLAITLLQFAAVPAICSVVDNTAIATTELMTALTPSDMALLRTGQQVDIDALPAGQRDQILDAFALICDGSLPGSIAKPTAGAKRLLQIKPRYILIFESDSLGSDKVSMDLVQFINALRSAPDSPATKQGGKSSTAKAPKFDTLKAKAPADAASSTTYWGNNAFELLNPIGEACLSNADSHVPYALSDFTNPAKSPLASLDKEKQTFVEYCYTLYGARAVDLREAGAGTGKDKTTVINGVSMQWLNQKLPL